MKSHWSKPILSDPELTTIPFAETDASFESQDFIQYLKMQRLRGNKIVVAEEVIGEEATPWLDGQFLSWIHKSEEYAAGLRDIQVNQDFTVSAHMSNRLSIELVLDGNFDVYLGDHTSSNQDQSRIYLSSYLDNGRQTRLYKKSAKIRSVGLWLPAGLLTNQFAVDTEKLSPTIRSIIMLERESTTILPLSTHMRQALEDMMSHKYQGSLGDEYMSAKTTELLCYFSELITSPEEIFELDNNLPRHKAQAMSTVLQCINNNLASPPGMEDLAKIIGLSRSVMANTFKSSYGLSITEYLLQKRMDAAHELLKLGKISILEVAIAVGYEDQSSFGRAYKKYHNHPPSGDKSKC
jgi:AraC-like DNA-binding protein